MLDEGLLRNEQAIVARDVDLRFGSLRSLAAPEEVVPVPESTRTIFKRRNGGWITSAGVAHFVESDLAADLYARIYSSGEDGDGNLRLRYSIDGSEKNVRLGVEAPATAAAIEAVTKTVTTWSRKWGWYWEEPDGTLAADKTLFADQNVAWDGQVVENTAGSIYTVPADIVSAVTALKPSAASYKAKLVFFFEALSSSGAILGRVYPESSALSADRDLFINGFKVSAKQSIQSGAAVFNLTYDETDVEEYTADRVYLFTHVDETGAESAPSPVSAMLTVRPDMDVKVLFPAFTQPADRSKIVKRRLYRTATGSAATAYQFVADVLISQNQYTDSLTDLELGESIPSIGWRVPPVGMASLVSIPGGFLAAYSGRTVCFSAVDAPHAWPDEYVVACDADIRGLAVVGNSVYVLTAAAPELITVATPANSDRAKVPYAQSCTSARSIVTSTGGVLFASPDGICQMVGLEIVVLSQVYLSKERWREMQTDGNGTFRPEDTVFSVYDDLLYIFSSGGSWTWDLVKPDRGLVELSQRATAAMYVHEDDGLYLAQGGKLLLWKDADSSNRLLATWRSKRFGFNKPIRFRRARISAEGPARLILRNYEGIKVYEIERTSAASFLLPPLNPRRWWAFELQSRSTITELSVGTSTAEM